MTNCSSVFHSCTSHHSVRCYNRIGIPTIETLLILQYCFRKALFDAHPQDPDYTPLPEDRPGGFNWGERPPDPQWQTSTSIRYMLLASQAYHGCRQCTNLYSTHLFDQYLTFFHGMVIHVLSGSHILCYYKKYTPSILSSVLIFLFW
jgi:hypothetical protein